MHAERGRSVLAHTLVIIGSDSVLARQARETATLLGYRSVHTAASPVAGDDDVFVAVDEPAERAALIAELPASRLVSLVHPSAVVSSSARLGQNVFVGPQAIVGMDSIVGDGVVQNALASIEHDNRIGAFTFLGTGAILCGRITVGERVFVGGGATVKPGLTIGDDTTLGTGAVLVKDALAGAVYVGNPAIPLR